LNNFRNFRDGVGAVMILAMLHMGVYVGNIIDGLVGLITLTKVHTTVALTMAKLYAKTKYDIDNRRK